MLGALLLTLLVGPQAVPAARGRDGLTLGRPELAGVVLERYAHGEQGRELLDLFLKSRLLDSLASQRGISVGQAEVAQRWRELEKRAQASGQPLSAEIERRNLTSDQFREFLGWADERRQLDRVERLRDVVEATGIDPARAVAHIRAGRQEDDRNAPRGLVREQPLGDRPPVEHGHHHVEQDRVRERCPRELEAARPVRSLLDGNPFRLEVDPAEEPDRGFVVDDERLDHRRNAALDGVRKRSRQTELPSEDVLSDLGDAEERAVDRIDESDYRDDVLRLLFICCHPDLPATQQIALALRIVSGLTVKQIARAFLVSEAAMEQRITRAKRIVADGDEAFETPGAVERSERLAAVAAMVYLIFNEGYTAARGDEWLRPQLCNDALRMGRVLTVVAPQEAEVHGLLALMELNASRTAARTDAAGDPVLLMDQNRARWDQLQIRRGLAALARTYELGGGNGFYALQAAIAALHASAPTPADTDWPQIAALFGELYARQPTSIVALNRAVAIAMWQGPAAGLALVDELADDLRDYHLWHAARADLLRRLDRRDQATAAYRAALERAGSEPERRFLQRRLSELA